MNAPGIPSSLNIKEYGDRVFDTKTEKWYFALVPLKLIPFTCWEPRRYVRNKELLQTTGTTKPIILDPGVGVGEILLVDGNHRCYCSNELGYTHIPAIVNALVKNDAFVKLSF